MVNALLAIVRALWSVWVFEIVGAGLVIWGLYEAHGTPAAAVAGGVAALAKSAELDLRSRGEQ